MTLEKKYENMKVFIIVLLILNVLLWVYIAFFKRDALWLETLKAGWTENMKMAQQLYNSPAYIQQQKSTLDQILWSIQQAWQQAANTTAPTTAQPEVQPTVTQ